MLATKNPKFTVKLVFLMKTGTVRALRITTLAENSAAGACLGQWGLSILLEIVDGNGDSRKMIFDTGINKRALLHNVRSLKIDLGDVDAVVLSHGHLDHTAATVEIVKASGNVKIYAHPHTFLPRFHRNKTGKMRSLGVPRGESLADIEKVGGTILLSSKPTEIVPGVWTTGEISRATRYERALPLSEGEKLIIMVDGKEVDDQILDDQALWMNVDGVGAYVITGCAHSGLINTLLHVQKIGQFRQLFGLVGGTHLVGRADEYLEQTISNLKRFGLCLMSPCHCTGFKAMSRLWNVFPEAFVLNFSGRTIEAENEPEPRVI
jgi:7,8-dihydropterin-6-yl-methyl-4-(beta-D-ribofuranosyl)aminobenzene 5'-phosphate synthase